MLDNIYELLNNSKDKSDLISKVRYTPDNNALIVDVNYNRALRVCVIKNEIHIQGDNLYAAKLKDFIEGALKECR